MQNMKRGALLAVSLLFSGCAANLPPAMVTSFDDVSSESEMVGKDSKVTQTKSISLLGLMPMLSPGDWCYNKASRSVDSVVCFAPTGTDSFYRTRTVGANVTNGDVIQVRNAIAKVVSRAEQYLHAKLELVKFDVNVELNGSQGDAATRDGKRTILATDLAAKDVKYQESLETLNQALSKPGMIVYTWNAHTDAESRMMIGKIFGLSMSESKNRSGFGVVGGIRVSHLFLGKGIVKEGNGDCTDIRPIGNVRTIASVPSEVNVRTKSVICENLLDKPSSQSDNDLLRLATRKFYGVPTTIFQAKHTAAFTEMEEIKRVEMALSATIDELSKIASRPLVALATTKLEFSLALSRMYKVTNSSVMGSGTVKDLPVLWSGRQDAFKEREGCDSEKDSSCWNTFYTISTQLQDLRDMLVVKDKK
ncbi:MAG: hypothetical protein HQL99_02310 [Magnetococcales bacterium]|nr:hypothetical protein [Magnetococcales bacterium]